MTDEQATQAQQVPETPSLTKPNDCGSVSVSGFVRIFDPETNETLVETRA